MTTTTRLRGRDVDRGMTRTRMVAVVAALVGVVLAASPSEAKAVDTVRVAPGGGTGQLIEADASSAPSASAPSEAEDGAGSALGPTVPRPGSQVDPGTFCDRLAGDNGQDTRPPSFTLKFEQDREFGYGTTLSLLDVRAHGCSGLATATVDWGEDWDAPDATSRRVLRPDLTYRSLTFAPHRYLVRPVPVGHRITVRVTDNAGRSTATDALVMTAPIFDVTVRPITFEASSGGGSCDIYAGKGDFEFSYWGVGPRRTERFDLGEDDTHISLPDGVTAYRIGAWQGRRLYYDWDELDSALSGLFPRGNEIGPPPRSVLLIGSPGTRTEERGELDPGDSTCVAALSFTITTVRRAD